MMASNLWDGICRFGSAGPPSCDNLKCCVTCVQASAAGAAAASSSSAAAVGPRVWLHYGTRGAARSVPFNPWHTIDELAEVAVKELEDLRVGNVQPNAIAAFKATYDKATRTATTEELDLDTCSSLAEAGISAGDHIVFKLRPPAATTGSAAASSGECRVYLQWPTFHCAGGLTSWFVTLFALALQALWRWWPAWAWNLTWRRWRLVSTDWIHGHGWDASHSMSYLLVPSADLYVAACAAGIGIDLTEAPANKLAAARSAFAAMKLAVPVAIPGSKTGARIITLPSTLPWPQLEAVALFVRNFYEDFYEGPLRRLERGAKFVICGNSGSEYTALEWCLNRHNDVATPSRARCV